MKINTNINRPYILSFIIIILSLGVPRYLLAQSNDDCLMCHSDNTMTMEREGKEVSIYVDAKVLASSPHKNLSCVSCHVGFDPDEMPHKENITPVNCKLCHSDAPTKHQFHPQMLHSKTLTADVNCKNCHGTHDIVSPKVPGSKWYSSNVIESCGNCHNDVVAAYKTSQHYLAYKNGEKSAPYCLTCHKSSIVSIKGVKGSAEIKLVQEKLCLSCHLDNPEVRERTIPSAGFIAQYDSSVHRIALSKGNNKAAGCVDCHTSHMVKKGSDPLSTVFRMNIPSTCGKCHAEIAKEYSESIHGVEAAKGNMDVPVCTTCHGEHNILEHNNPKSPVSFKNVSTQVCSPCHSSIRLSEKYGIKSDRFKTYSDSYHGLALKGGSMVVANCASCHGVHNIKPSSDPASTVNKANLANTCGNCHRGANQNFAVGKVHVNVTEKSEPLLYWISITYIILIITVIGGMFFHNIVDFIRKSKIIKLRKRGYLKEEPVGHSLYLRMNMSERIQHGVLAISFILLVITGFMLRFPDTWWVGHIRSLSQDAFEYRSLIHRIAAVFLIGVSLYHIGYISFTVRGRKLIKDLFPVYKDLRDAIDVAKFNLGISKVKPKLGRFSYIEKSEYWALVWGTIVMSVTGIIMWFDNTFIGLLTKLGWDVANTIHYFEAWLAFLAIIVWHFYFVIFNPDIYPMNTSWLTGKLTEEEMHEEHPAELEELKKSDIEKNEEEKDDSEKD